MAPSLASLTLVAGVSAAPAAEAADTSTITFNVVGCNGCAVQPVLWDDTRGDTWQGDSVTVVAIATVPTANTEGMSFNFTAPWAVEQYGLQNIVLEYIGVAVGSSPTRAKSLASTKASGC